MAKIWEANTFHSQRCMASFPWGLFMGKLELTVEGTTRAVVMTSRRLPEDDYFCALIAAGATPPEIDAIPCWSTAD